MTDILKSEAFIFCKDIDILCRTKIPECQVHIGVLKVTVHLGSGRRNFGNNFMNKLSNEGMHTEVGSDCEDMKPDALEHTCEASLKPVSDASLAPKHHASNISRRIIKNSSRNGISHDINEEDQFCKNSEQEIELDHKVTDSSLSERSLNEVRLALLCTYSLLWSVFLTLILSLSPIIQLMYNIGFQKHVT
jgi:hypothetical protein